MALLFKGSLVCFVMWCCNALMVSSTEFIVGGQDGWAVPKSHDHYNDWASSNRFVVHDTLRFKYEKDSVIEVNEEDYKKCKPSQPLFFSNNGDTVFTFDRPGLFYFISGVSGHCDRGQKIIVKVLDLEAHSPQPQQQQNPNGDVSQQKGAASPHIAPMAKATSALFVVSLFLVLLFA